MARRPKNELGAELAASLTKPTPPTDPAPAAAPMTPVGLLADPAPLDPFAFEIPPPETAEDRAREEAARKARVAELTRKTMNPYDGPTEAGEMPFKDLAFALASAGFRVGISDVSKWPLVQRLQARAWLEDYTDPPKPTPDFLLPYLNSVVLPQVVMTAEHGTVIAPGSEPLPATKARLGYERTPSGDINNCSLVNGADEEGCQVCGGLCPDKSRLVGAAIRDVERRRQIGAGPGVQETAIAGALAEIPAPENPWTPPAEVPLRGVKKPSEESFVDMEPRVAASHPPLWASATGGKISPDYQRIVETVYAVDAFRDYRDLEENLEVGEQRGDYATIREHLDKAEKRGRRAHLLLLGAKLERAAWERDADRTRAVMRERASAELEVEKKAGDRKKMITDADVTTRMGELYPDEWHAQEMTRHKLKGVESTIEDLVSKWSSKAASLRTLLETMRK